jgi:catechol 2,3-dioxygenase-like lactoylglutathione lyase family enzyme
MVAFSGVDHVGFSVTDLDRSERFYTDVFDLVRMMDFGYGRILLHRQTGFVFGITTHEGSQGTPFTELTTGLDHLGFTAASRDELVEWEHKLEALGVTYTPIRDMEFGYHLNFRDPDNIALEISAYNDLAISWLAEAKERDIPQDELEARISAYLASLAPEGAD